MHEWAHALGYAKDIAYYSSRCQKLAKDNPDKAVKNADSYSFHYWRATELSDIPQSQEL